MRLPVAPPRMSPSATPHGTDRSRRASHTITPATTIARIGKTGVNRPPRLKAAPLLRVTLK
jgi:hypothetical protein